MGGSPCPAFSYALELTIPKIGQSCIYVPVPLPLDIWDPEVGLGYQSLPLHVHLYKLSIYSQKSSLKRGWVSPS